MAKASHRSRHSTCPIKGECDPSFNQAGTLVRLRQKPDLLAHLDLACGVGGAAQDVPTAFLNATLAVWAT